MLYLIIGFAVAFNILIIIWKLRHKDPFTGELDRTADGLIDGALLVAVALLFSGSEGLLIIGTIGSAIVSLYLLISPIKFEE